MQHIKEILDSEAGLLIENNNEDNKIVVDNRFELLKQRVDLIENKNDNFYSYLIKVISDYLNELYDSKIQNFPSIVLDINGKLISQEYNSLNTSDIYKLSVANSDLANKLFEYVSEILENNKNIQLGTDTITKLFNRNPKATSFSVEQTYLYRAFDYKKLVNIINENDLLKKSNINIEEIYQILIDSFQIDNDIVFEGLINSDDFKKNHQKVIDLLKKCNATTFLDITNIIIRHFDKDFDRLSIVKSRNKDYFIERVIIELLNHYLNEEDCNFIHEILSDENIKIDYNYDYADYFGQTSLKELLALKGNKVIIKALLSKEENIQSNYWHGESKIQLYRLYAILGEYDKAINLFQQKYNYANDFTEDFYDGFNKDGIAYGDITYEDSFVEFLEAICTSFKNENIEYLTQIEYISRILNSENVKFINLEEVLSILFGVLNEEDFELLLQSLNKKYNNGSLKYFVVNEQEEGLFRRYKINIVNKEEKENILSIYNNEEVKSLNKKLK